MTAPKIEWQAPEFEARAKDVFWYWLSIAIAIFVLTAAMWQRNFLFGFFVVVAETLIIVWGNKEPRELSFSLDERGLMIAARIYPLRDMAAFSLEDGWNDDWSELRILLKQNLRSVLSLAVPKEKTSAVRALLRAALPEKDIERSLVENMERFLGF